MTVPQGSVHEGDDWHVNEQRFGVINMCSPQFLDSLEQTRAHVASSVENGTIEVIGQRSTR